MSDGWSRDLQWNRGSHGEAAGPQQSEYLPSDQELLRNQSALASASTVTVRVTVTLPPTEPASVHTSEVLRARATATATATVPVPRRNAVSDDESRHWCLRLTGARAPGAP